ncbi:hypothetical protein SLA2020_319970 [Shorea laevis]
MDSMQVLLLMATAVDCPTAESPTYGIAHALEIELRRRQQILAENTEMIHVASLIQDDILDGADTRRGIGSLNFVRGNKAVSLLATVVEILVTGETMQMMATTDQYYSMEYHMRKSYNKTASLISNSCKAMALLSGQTAGVAELAFDHGKNPRLAYQLIDDILDFTGTSASLGKRSLSDIRISTSPHYAAIDIDSEEDFDVAKAKTLFLTSKRISFTICKTDLNWCL